MFVCGGRRFTKLEYAKAFADNWYKTRGVILGIEERK